MKNVNFTGGAGYVGARSFERRSARGKKIALPSLWVLLGLLLSSGSKSEPAAAGATGTKAQAAQPAAQGAKLAFVTNNASEFWKIAQAGVRTYEREAKVQVDVILPDGTVADQNEKLEELASQSYDAVAVSVVAPNDQVSKLDEVARKAKLITFDSDAEKSQRLLYIGTNNYEAGKALGAEIVKLLPEGGEMAVFVGTFSADNAQQRLKGIEDAISGHNIQIVARREDQTDHAKAQSNVEDIINAHPDLDLVAGLWSYNGPAIALAIERLGKKGQVKAAVFDEEEETLRGIESGSIAVTVVQKPFQFGYLSSKWMHELVTQPDAQTRLPEGRAIDTGVEVITRANVADFKAKLAELKAIH